MTTDRPGGGANTGDPSSASLGGEGVDPRIGTIIANRYSLVRLLGRGGMGSVYEARDVMLNRRWAVKFLLPHLAGNRELLRRFENEAKAAGGLEHPNLVAVTDFGYVEGSPYIVMEFLQGEDCSKLLHRMGPLPVPRAANIVRQACRGLAVAHKRGIVHRDLKPENLFLTDAGDGTDLVKVLDFGIAKLRDPDVAGGTRTGATMGTAYYMAPEQARGARDVDERADVWSLGVVLYELLGGRRPFGGETFLQVIHQILSVDPPSLATLRPGLPRELVATVERAMSKETAGRLPTVAALGDVLARFADRASYVPAPAKTEAPMTAPTPATAGRPWIPEAGESVMPWGRTAPTTAKGRRRVATVATLGALAVAATGAAVWQRTVAYGRVNQPTMNASAPASAVVAVEIPKAPVPAELRPNTAVPAQSSSAPAVSAEPTNSKSWTPQHAPPSGRAAKPAPPSTAQPAVPPKPTPAPAPAPTLISPAAPPRRETPTQQELNCNPPYTVLPNGAHKPKPECM